MSNSALHRRNRGAYSTPYSGVGVEYFPLGVPADHAGFVLHEVGYLPCNDWWNFPKVLSPFWRLYYNRRKGHHIVFSGRNIELTPEHIMLIPDGQLFHCHGFTPVPSLWLAFQVAQRLTPQQTIPLMFRPTGTELTLMRDLSQLISDDPDSQTRDRIFHLGMALLHIVLGRSEIHWQGPVPTMVAQTVQYVEENFASPLSIPRLARMANLSVEQLARSFKRYQGETLGRFVTKVRVREAAHLLLHTEMRIDDIAKRTGFPNREYFSRVFKTMTGESPAEFRHRHK